MAVYSHLYKMVALRKADWNEVKILADELAAERGVRISQPAAIMESVKFYHNNRMAGTPGGKVSGNDTGEQAQRKEVIS